jgi:hypothetical protein
MNDKHLRNVTAAILLLVPVAFNTLFTMLSVMFEYPDILRQPAADVLARFDEGGNALIATWYGFMLTAVMFVPLAILVWKVLAPTSSSVLALSAAFGVVAGVVQFLGLVRWPFLVPYLADAYLDPESSAATKEAVLVVFESFNRFAGVGIGENLGYLFTALWTLCIAFAVLASKMRYNRWVGVMGVIAAGGILAGMLEPAGVEVAADVVVIGYIVWSVWLIVLGVLILRLPGSAGVPGPARGAGGPFPHTESSGHLSTS